MRTIAKDFLLQTIGKGGVGSLSSAVKQAGRHSGRVSFLGATFKNFAAVAAWLRLVQ
jgi:hypothetical protein